jgi:hypothetical protein
MLTNNANLGTFGDLGWGWKSLNPVNVIKKTVIAPTKFITKKSVDVGKFAVKRGIIAPTKLVGKSVVGTTKASFAVGKNLAKGNVKGAFKAAIQVVRAPGQLAYDSAKQAGGTVVAASKAVTDFALAPLRSRLGTLKSRRAKKLAWDKRQSTTPTAAESAQARKDVKSMLSSKGPHGKMLSWLAGGPMLAGELGVVGYDDAAIAAIATALTGVAVKIINDAVKSKFAPVDAAKAGATSLTTSATQAAATATTNAAQKYLPPAEEPAAKPVTQEDVAAEPAAQAEEAAIEEDTAAMEGALANLGMLSGFAGVAEEAVAPASMTETTAKRIASAAQRMVCGMSAPALNAIGGLEAINAAGTLCRAAAVGDEAAVRAVLPSVVQIAARASTDFASRATSMGIRNEGGLPNDGFGAASASKKAAYRACVKFQIDELEASPSDARYECQGELQGVDASEIGMLAAFDGADPEGLAYGLAGVTPDDLAAVSTAQSVSLLALLPMSAVVAAGLWLAFRK